MPAYLTDPKNQIIEIQRNLRDRYRTRLSILKELIQNADDARSRVMHIDLRVGQPRATNPLLQGPGLLVVNDGRFTPDDDRGIKTLSATSKAEEAGSAGRFGLGQKAVFHVSDAFIAVPFGYSGRTPFVVSPFNGLQETRPQTDAWDDLTGVVDQLRQWIDHTVFSRPHLALWLPLRREGILLAAGQFDSWMFGQRNLLAELTQAPILATVLSAARHLDRIEIQDDGRPSLSLIRDGAHMEEVVGQGGDGAAQLPDGQKPFGGLIRIEENEGARSSAFRARQLLSGDGVFKTVKDDEDWPQTWTIRNKPIPEKAEPHGAAFLVRHNGPGSRLTIHWGVFLPTGEEPHAKIPIESPDADTNIDLHLFLHGYFFVDSGRRHIMGFEHSSDSTSSAYAEICAKWNRLLRDQVTLPMLPGLFADALRERLLSPSELARLVGALASDGWFVEHRAAIASREQLAEVWDGHTLEWRTLPAEIGLRPIPARLLSRPGTLSRVFPELMSFARSRNVAPYAAAPGLAASLSASDPDWQPEEIAALLRTMPAMVFKSRALADALHSFLDGVCPRVADERIGRSLCGKLRDAILEDGQFADAVALRGILHHVPDRLLIGLSETGASAEVLQGLAATGQEPLAVRAVWLDETHQAIIADEAALADLLRALERLTSGPQVDRAAPAARAAMELIRASRRQLSTLAANPEFRDIAIFPVSEEPGHLRRILSLHDLFERGRAGTLFQLAGVTNINLRPLLEALPGLRLSLTNDKELLQFAISDQDSAWNLDNPKAVAFVNAATGFGEPSSRSALLRRFTENWADSDAHFAAVRRLLAGISEAGPRSATLYQCEERVLAALAEQMLQGNRSAFVAAAELVEQLSLANAREIGLQRLDAPVLEEMLSRAADVGNLPDVTPDQADALLALPISPQLLKQLPIHLLETGAFNPVDDTVCLVSPRPVPAALRPYLRRVVAAGTTAARQRQSELIPPHDAAAELRAALAAPEPAALSAVIMDALADNYFDDRQADAALRARLRSTRWLTIGSVTIAPDDILSLPDAVSDAAKMVLGTAHTLAWYPQGALPPSVRDHPAFPRLTSMVLPGMAQSLELLALQITEAQLIGLPVRYPGGSAGEAIRADLATLARVGSALPLPGWPLAAALIATDQATADAVDKCLVEFHEASRGDITAVAASLGALGDLAERKGSIGEAAMRLYRLSFQDLAGRSLEHRRAVFAKTRVPTAAGNWKPAREVARDGAGLAPGCLLDPALADVLRPADRSARPPDALHLDATSAAGMGVVQPVATDLRKLEQLSAKGHRAFLEPYRNRIPANLAVAYLALVGRFPAMGEVIGEWETYTTVAPDTLIEKIDREIDRELPTSFGISLRQEIDGRRFLVVPVTEGSVEAVSLCGSLFSASQDGNTGVLVGNRHMEPELTKLSDGRLLSVYTLELRHGATGDAQHSIDGIKELAQQVAIDCLWLQQVRQVQAVDRLLAEVSNTAQSLLGETEALLREDLPVILKSVKGKRSPVLGGALREYEDAQRDRIYLGKDAEARQTAEQALWNTLVASGAAQAELLELIRAKLRELGYDSRRTLLELFQNADDATLQLNERDNPGAFRLEGSDERFRVVHWGRPINHRGTDPRQGEALGWDRDLINMLVMNFSDKLEGDQTTGKFGLGFKCVHALSDSVGIASGLIAMRTHGGLLPVDWAEGVEELKPFQAGGVPTLIDVLFAEGREADGRRSMEAFLNAAPCLPLFAKAIRSIEIEAGARSASHRRASDVAVPGVPDVSLGKVEGSAPFSALLFDLGEGYTLAAKLEATGLVPFPATIPRLWHVCPLDQRIESGWLIDGPFRLTTSRSELHGDVAPLFRQLGRRLGEQFVLLHRAATANWAEFAEALGLDADLVPELFWKRLWSLFRSDLDDDVASEVHADGNGLAALAASAPVVPSGLPRPFDQLVRGSQVIGCFAGALTSTGLLGSIAHWPSVARHPGTFVTGEYARDLERLQFPPPEPITMTSLLQREFVSIESKIEVKDAERLGTVLSKVSIRQSPLATELDSLLRQVATARFRDATNAWRAVDELSISQSEDRAEHLRAMFAPPERRLLEAYMGEALQFVELAREQAGHSPTPELLRSWTERAHMRSGRIAALRYLIEIDTGAFKARILAAPPSWLLPLDQVADGTLTEDWTYQDRNHLRSVLRNYEPAPPPAPDPAPTPDRLSPEPVIEAIWDWWAENRDEQIELYDRAVYPTGFDPKALAKSGDRGSWFTLFALAAFQNFGGTEDGQHRTFIEEGLQQGWWLELAQSRPPEEFDVWLARLESWSSAMLPDLTHWRWRRALLDLYTVARWLPQYRKIIELLPRAIEEQKRVRLSDALNPSFSPIWQRTGIDAAPLVRTLGIGLNWLLRECTRLGVHDAPSAKLIAPYGWATTWRLRNLLIGKLGAILDDAPSMDASPVVWGFVEPLVPKRHERILVSDLDLPLQLITRSANQSVLEECCANGGV